MTYQTNKPHQSPILIDDELPLETSETISVSSGAEDFDIQLADDDNFEIILEDDSTGVAKIKVIGVGGAGGNAVRHMMQKGIHGVETICINTDMQALNNTGANKQLGIGVNGRGAGAKPELARAAAENKREDIKAQLEGADMVIIAAGMGGGTGTGASPLIAQIARELNILTVAIVTKPFSYEGKRHAIAEQGIKELSQHVDSLFVVLNEKLEACMGEDATVEACYRCADEVLYDICSGIVKIVLNSDEINTDFEDVRTALTNGGQSFFTIVDIEDQNDYTTAIEKALANPLMEKPNLQDATSIMLYLEASPGLKMGTMNGISKVVSKIARDQENLNTFNSYHLDEKLGKKIRATILMSGFNQRVKMPRLVEDEDTQEMVFTGTDDAFGAAVRYQDSQPAVMPQVYKYDDQARNRMSSSMNFDDDMLDIPAYLRKQAN